MGICIGWRLEENVDERVTDQKRVVGLDISISIALRNLESVDQYILHLVDSTCSSLDE